MSDLTDIKYSHLGNDLFWTAYHHKGSDHFEKITWTGYNDSYWWSNVADTEQFTVRQCTCGDSFKLDPYNHTAEKVGV
jgi:hypothetical protein